MQVVRVRLDIISDRIGDCTVPDILMEWELDSTAWHLEIDLVDVLLDRITEVRTQQSTEIGASPDRLKSWVKARRPLNLA